MNTLHVLQHVPFEGCGLIQNWCIEHRITVRVWRLDLADPLPIAQAGDGICIMGGPMNIYEEDRYPWLKRTWIRSFLGTDIPMLGVCLGGQLLADALGSKVYANRVKNALALQFHLEAGISECRLMTENCGDELAQQAPTVHDASRLCHDSGIHSGAAFESLRGLLNAHFGL